jgi:hypothetical protein
MKYEFCSIMTMVLNRFEQAEEKARNGQESNLPLSAKREMDCVVRISFIIPQTAPNNRL